MSSQDALWLTMDRPNNLMVIDTLMWFDERLDLDAVREVVQRRLVDEFSVFKCKAVQDSSGWTWEPDEAFALDNHVRIATLPGDAGFAELQDWVGAQRSLPLDRSRPLWTFTVVENFRPDPMTLGSAVMVRSHHAIADGVRLTQVMIGICDVEGEPPSVGTQLRRSTTPIAIATSAISTLASSAADIAAASFRSTTSVAQSAVNPAVWAQAPVLARGAAAQVGATIRNPARLADVAKLVSTDDNRPVNDAANTAKLLFASRSVDTVWSGDPQAAKSVGWAPMLPLDEVKRIGKATGTTVNDVLLGVVAGTLTRYLAEHGDETTDELLWMVPVSLRPYDPDSSDELGNHFSLVMVRLPMGIDDVTERLNEINRRMARIKASDEPLLTFSVQRAISHAPGTLGAGLTNFFANKAVGVLTNVPGPRGPISFAGTTVAGLLGWAPCSGDQPMTICIFSYNGKVSVGFGTDAALIPDADRLGELFFDEFDAMSATIVG